MAKTTFALKTTSILSVLCLFVAGISFPSGITRAKTTQGSAGLYLNGYGLQGTEVKGFEKFDKLVTSYMRQRGIPGGALAVTKNGRLVYARGYGLANKEANEPVRPDSLFRIASISKCLTSAAIMVLVQNGRLGLDDRVFELLNVPAPFGCREDERIKQITVRQMLQHTGGFDREHAPSFDPMFATSMIAQSLGSTPPAGQLDIIRYMLGRPLDFDPGTKYAYSNFGYCVLGRIIERVSGQRYETFVKENVLLPAGIRNMRLGRTRLEDAAPREVHYYQPEDGLHSSVFPDVREQVPAPYGAWCLENMDSHGGWLGSAVDLVRFAAILDFPEKSPLLSKASMAEISRRPAPPAWIENGRTTDYYYGLGWNVRPIKAGKSNLWHVGSLDGTFGLLVRRYDGLSWAVLFNKRSANPDLPDSSIDAALHVAADSVPVWPREDLFPTFGFPKRSPQQ